MKTSYTDSNGNRRFIETFATLERRRNFVKYEDATHEYYCTARVGAPLSSPEWQVIRKEKLTGNMIYAGLGGFKHMATDLTTVVNLTYTLEP